MIQLFYEPDLVLSVVPLSVPLNPLGGRLGTVLKTLCLKTLYYLTTNPHQTIYRYLLTLFDIVGSVV